MSTIPSRRPRRSRRRSLSTLAMALIPLALLLGAASPSGGSCCRPPPINMTQFLLRSANTVPCTPTGCINTANTLACAVSMGCGSDNQCIFALKPDASCTCYETDFRACPSGASVAQACARTSAASTLWQVDGAGQPICGPTEVACATNRSACPSGHVGTKYDLSSRAWVRDPAGTCTPEPACPAWGATQTCKTGNARCPDGIRTFDGDVWSATCVPQNCPTCVANVDAPCGCGGTIACNGACTAPGPSNLGAACGCGGTIACNGACTAPGPGNLGAGCGCGGTIQCDGRCSHDCSPEHQLKAVFNNIDDDAYVWLDHPGSTDQAICKINGGNVPRSGECDLQAALHQRGATAGRLVFKIGNGGGFGSKGTMRIFVDGSNEAWRGDEIDNGWKHTGWTYCSKVDVNLATGSVAHHCTSSCALWLDCDNDCKDCP